MPVIASAAVELIDLKGILSLWRLSRVELSIAVIALLGVISLGVLAGVIVGVEQKIERDHDRLGVAQQGRHLVGRVAWIGDQDGIPRAGPGLGRIRAQGERSLLGVGGTCVIDDSAQLGAPIKGPFQSMFERAEQQSDYNKPSSPDLDDVPPPPGN